MKNIIGFVFAAVVLVVSATAAHAWGVYQYRGDGSAEISCSDGTYALVGPDGGSWTAISGHNTGGSFAIMGQAAVYACNE